MGRIRGARGFPALQFTERAMRSVAPVLIAEVDEVPPRKLPRDALLSLALTRTTDTDAIPPMFDAH